MQRESSASWVCCRTGMGTVRLEDDGTVVVKTYPEGGKIPASVKKYRLEQGATSPATAKSCSGRELRLHGKGNHITKTGAIHRGRAYDAFRKSGLKEMHMVRYADDFKIFCATRKDADRAYHATKAWLQERLKLVLANNCLPDFRL